MCNSLTLDQKLSFLSLLLKRSCHCHPVLCATSNCALQSQGGAQRRRNWAPPPPTPGRQKFTTYKARDCRVLEISESGHKASLQPVLQEPSQQANRPTIVARWCRTSCFRTFAIQVCFFLNKKIAHPILFYPPPLTIGTSCRAVWQVFASAQTRHGTSSCDADLNTTHKIFLLVCFYLLVT